MTILIVDDHPIVRKGIHALLTSAFADAEVIDASCLKEAEAACSTRNVNIMITDLDLNGESGLTLIKRVRDILPSLQIIIYTMHEEPWSVCQMADTDTEGVVMKSDNASELVKAVKHLNEGKGHYSPTFVRLLNALKLQPSRLSEREQQVIDLTAKGLSTSDMAAQLGISANTVEFHRRRIMQKLNVANAAEMIRRATELGWRTNI